MNLAKYALDNTKIVYFFLAVLLIGGILSFDRLGKKEDAPFVIKSAVIMTRYPGAEPAEVERLITEPISREIQSMSGVYKIKSESMYGLSKITFELQPSLSAESIPQKWDELRRKVLNIQPQLPAGASVPTVSDDFGDVFGIYYGLVGDDGFSYEEMRNWAERIKTQVITADGVMKVALFGTQTEVVNIYISVNKLAGMGIDPEQVASLLQSQNQIINTGEINAGVISYGDKEVVVEPATNQVVLTDVPADAEISIVTKVVSGETEYQTAVSKVASSTLVTQIAMDNWTVLEFSSQQESGEGAGGGHASHAIDGDLNTFWHTQYSPNKPGYPHYMVIDMQEAATIQAVAVARRNNNANFASKMRLEVSSDHVNWEVAGEFMPDNTINGLQMFRLTNPLSGQYVKLTAVSGATSEPYFCLSEVNLYK